MGRGLQTLYLPEAHTDFVAAIIGEEFGFVGILCLCLVFMALVARGVRTALRSPDDYGSYLAFGISTMFGVQALVNLCVALSIVPTKGLTLPFISFGGSSLLVNAAAAGILLNISRHAQQKGDYEEDKAEPPKSEKATKASRAAPSPTSSPVPRFSHIKALIRCPPNAPPTMRWA